MKIHILYESKYSLSTTNDKNEILGSSKQLKEYEQIDKDNKPFLSKKRTFHENLLETNKIFKNFKYTDITHNTVVGILSRLMGDIRRIEDINQDTFIKKIEHKISFENRKSCFQNEIVRLSNAPKELASGAVGIIDSNASFLFYNNILSEKTFGIFKINDIETLKNILDGDFTNISQYEDKINQTTFVNLVKSSSQKVFLKSLNITSKNGIAYKQIGTDYFYGLENDIIQLEELMKREKKERIDLKMQINSIPHNKIKKNFIFSFLFLKYIAFLKTMPNYKIHYESLLLPMLSKSGNFMGIAANSGFVTEKDLLSDISKPNLSWNLPLSAKLEVFHSDDRGEGKVSTNVGLTKESGELIINLDLSLEEATQLIELIENAGVNTFHLGKKGLAYVSKIELENT